MESEPLPLRSKLVPVTIPWPSMNPVLLMSGSTAPWNISTCNWGPWESRSKAWWDDVLYTCQNRNWGNKSGLKWTRSWVMIPHCPPRPNALFLVEGAATEWDDGPGSPTPVSMDSLWPAPGKSHQNCHTYAGGARPKVPTKPSAGQSQSRTWSMPKEGPDPVNHPHRWIHAEMEKYCPPHMAGRH